MSGSPAPPIEVFISYSHNQKDAALREQLETHLALLKRQGIIDLWHDRRIGAGREWVGAIDEHLNSAAVILLLVSANFVASDYCYDLEMTRALERHDAGDARVIPIILRTTFWEGAPFARLQALPEHGRAITEWGNRDRAFTDVARGIHNAVQEIRAAQASAQRIVGGRTQRLPPIWNVPPRRNPHFTGRDDLLDRLHRELGAHARVALTGAAGVGKTQLVLEYAYRHAHEFDLVWWLRAEEPTTLHEDYAALAVPLGLPEAGERELAVIAYAVREELLRRERWLLVFDNASEAKEVLPLVPGGQGRIAITSRNPAWPFVPIVDLRPLTRSASVTLLLAGTGQNDRGAADALAAELGDLPLALEQAAAYIKERGTALSQYLADFRARRAAA
jgi:TIR domain